MEIERQERSIDLEVPDKPTGHLVAIDAPDLKIALCGARLRGVVAYGEYEKCAECTWKAQQKYGG